MKIKYISKKEIRVFIELFILIIIISSYIYMNVKNRYISKEVFVDGIEEIE